MQNSKDPTKSQGTARRRVAVIGAGPAGAIATDALVKEQAFDVVRVFERKTVPGGTWSVLFSLFSFYNADYVSH